MPSLLKCYYYKIIHKENKQILFRSYFKTNWKSFRETIGKVSDVFYISVSFKNFSSKTSLFLRF